MNRPDNEEHNELKQGKGSSFRAVSLEKLGSLIAAKRVSMNMSQEALGLRTGIHRSYISEIERGQRNFTIKVLAQMTECLNLSMSHLLREASREAEETDQ